MNAQTCLNGRKKKPLNAPVLKPSERFQASVALPFTASLRPSVLWVQSQACISPSLESILPSPFRQCRDQQVKSLMLMAWNPFVERDEGGPISPSLAPHPALPSRSHQFCDISPLNSSATCRPVDDTLLRASSQSSHTESWHSLFKP